MNYKHIIFSVVSLLALAVKTASATNLIKGMRERGDSEICSQYVDVPARPGIVLEQFVTCTVRRSKQKITYIAAIDMDGSGKNGFAKITIGGVDKKKVTLHLLSQQGQPLKFNIQVYAKNRLDYRPHL